MVRRRVGVPAYARRMGGRRGSPSTVAGVAVFTALGTAGTAPAPLSVHSRRRPQRRGDHRLRRAPPAAPAATGGDEIALYRDRALLAQRVELVAPRAGPTRSRSACLPASIPAAVQVLDRGELAAIELAAARAVEIARPRLIPGGSR